jgi:hypothetical protein
LNFSKETEEKLDSFSLQLQRSLFRGEYLLVAGGHVDIVLFGYELAFSGDELPAFLALEAFLVERNVMLADVNHVTALLPAH